MAIERYNGFGRKRGQVSFLLGFLADSRSPSNHTSNLNAKTCLSPFLPEKANSDYNQRLATCGKLCPQKQTACNDAALLIYLDDCAVCEARAAKTIGSLGLLDYFIPQ